MAESTCCTWVTKTSFSVVFFAAGIDKHFRKMSGDLVESICEDIPYVINVSRTWVSLIPYGLTSDVIRSWHVFSIYFMLWFY